MRLVDDGTPDAVLRRDDLSRACKIEILRRWERDARELAVADDENMGGDEASSNAVRLQLVRQALRTLGAGQDASGTAPTKHGGG